MMQYISICPAEVMKAYRDEVRDSGIEKAAAALVGFIDSLVYNDSESCPDTFRELAENYIQRAAERSEKGRASVKARWEKKNKPEPQPEPKTVKAEIVNEIPQKKQAKRMFGELQNVLLSDDEEMKLREKLGLPEKFDLAISILSNYKASSGKRYKSDYAAILNWVIGRVEEEFAKRRGSTTGMSQAQRLAIGMAGGR